MARILRQTTVIRDGMHNAFTDLQVWGDAYLVAYRKGSAHISVDGVAVVACSIDRQRWREIACVKVPGDNRDPKIFPIADSRLALTIPSWVGGYSKRDLQQFIAFSEDGVNWDKPHRILPPGHWLWRIREHNGLLYGLVHVMATASMPGHLAIFTSTDFISWQHHCAVGSRADRLNESDIIWLNDGTAWLVARDADQEPTAWFARSSPPYTEWELTSLPHLIHAPIMLSHGDNIYLAGRCDMDVEGMPTFPFLSRKALALWRLSDGELAPVMHIPTLCDCAYPGLSHDGEERICLSYYSQHAYRMGVLDPPYRANPEEPFDQATLLTPADVYFAELELP